MDQNIQHGLLLSISYARAIHRHFVIQDDIELTALQHLHVNASHFLIWRCEGAYIFITYKFIDILPLSP